MWLRVYVYCVPEIRTEAYQEYKQMFTLVPRVVEQYFKTSWYELDTNDQLLYENTIKNTTYQKLYISNKEGLESCIKIYEGNPLTIDELQSKLKHWSRLDESL
jgi:hypothetical protein